MILALSVDVVYIFAIVVLAVILYGSCTFSGSACVVTAFFTVMMFMTVVVALSYRIATDSLFFVMRRHETIILESLNDVPCDLTGDKAAPEDVYKEIFDRVVDYFETDLPYLRGNLVIEDLVKVVYANKLYISRAIGRCAGRNFCQFVNYYRVRHSVEVFRRNPDLKVTELAGHCGFNSVVSFTMAFKLYMNENPSDWMRKERSRIIKFGQ
jgi:AraC-like DNA-binding protein